MKISGILGIWDFTVNGVNERIEKSHIVTYGLIYDRNTSSPQWSCETSAAPNNPT
jgi:hypothetical protein